MVGLQVADQLDWASFGANAMKNEIKQDYRAAVDILQSLQGIPAPKPMTAFG